MTRATAKHIPKVPPHKKACCEDEYFRKDIRAGIIFYEPVHALYSPVCRTPLIPVS